MLLVGILSLLLGNAASVAVALALSRRIRTGTPWTDTLIVLLVRLLLISSTVLVLGLTGLLNVLAVTVVSVIGLATALPAVMSLRVPWNQWRAIGGGWGIAVLLILARLLLQVWFFSPHNLDPLSYHLPKLAEWIRAGGFTGELGVDNHASFPAGFELVETWWVLFLRHDVLIEMAGVEFVILAFSAVYAMSRDLGMTSIPSFLASILYAMTPGIQMQATSCMNDGPVAALLVASMALILTKAPVGILAMAAGLGIGVKATYAYALPGLAVLVLLTDRPPRLNLRTDRISLGLGTLGILAGCYWYARNALVYGNPFHPVGGEGVIKGGVKIIQFGPSLQSLVDNVLDLVDRRIRDAEGPYSAYLDKMAGWGPVAFSCGSAGLVLQLRTHRRLRFLAAAFAVSLMSVLLLSIHDDYYMRFALFFPALLAIGAADLASGSRPALVVVSAGLLLTFLGTLLPYDLPLRDFRVLARQDWRSRSAAELFQLKTRGPVIAYFARNDGPAYLLYGPDFSRRVVYVRAGTGDEILRLMRREGARVVYASFDVKADRQILKDLTDRGLLEVVDEHTFALKGGDSP